MNHSLFVTRIAADFNREPIRVVEVNAFAGRSDDGAFELDLCFSKQGHSAFHLVGSDVKGKMVSAGEAFGRIGIGGCVVGFPKEVENRAVWRFEVGDFAFSDEFD